MNERKTHYERVMGGTEAGKEAAFRELERLFEEKDEGLAEYELEKTEEDKEVIGQTTALVDEMVKEYGGDPKPLPPDNIHILKPDAVKEISNGRLAGAIHRPLGLHTGTEKKDSRYLFASGIAHELFHLKSYKSARVGADGDLHLYRSGLSMIDAKDHAEASGEEKEYFAVLEEAI